jgi:hypothetical protein
MNSVIIYSVLRIMTSALLNKPSSNPGLSSSENATDYRIVTRQTIMSKNEPNVRKSLKHKLFSVRNCFSSYQSFQRCSSHLINLCEISKSVLSVIPPGCSFKDIVLKFVNLLKSETEPVYFKQRDYGAITFF